MDYRRYGKTGLEVSAVGVGTGGASRLGLAYGSSEDDAVKVVHRALELGINYFDTAENYKNEHVLGRALVGHRDEVVLSSKIGADFRDGSLRDPSTIREAVELSLSKLKTDVIEIFHLHGVEQHTYDHAMDALVPELSKLRDEGKIRFLAVSESSGGDVDHKMLRRAVRDDCWDVMMVSFNLFNQSARRDVFADTIANGVGIEIMASARTQFSQPDRLLAELERLVAADDLSRDQIPSEDPLSFLRYDGEELSITEASYRFAAYEPGVHVVLIGTGKVEHLEQNVRALERGPLPPELRDRFVSMFGHLQAEIHVPGRHNSPI